MNKPKELFLGEIEKMIFSRQYNEEAMDKLATMIAVCKLLAGQKKNKDDKDNFLRVIVAGETLQKRLLLLKHK